MVFDMTWDESNLKSSFRRDFLSSIMPNVALWAINVSLPQTWYAYVQFSAAHDRRNWGSRGEKIVASLHGPSSVKPASMAIDLSIPTKHASALPPHCPRNTRHLPLLSHPRPLTQTISSPSSTLSIRALPSPSMAPALSRPLIRPKNILCRRFNLPPLVDTPLSV